jgi:glycine/D-amino acid oxidase-like deaminating enzyme
MRVRLGITDLELLDASAARRRLDVAGVLAAGFTPNCAVVHPGRMARGLAEVVERQGAALVERTRVLELRPGHVVTDRGVVRADVIVCATEGYTGGLRPHRRRVLPLYSRSLATEPLAPDVWAGLGWADRMTVSESRYQFAYFQRTADDRLVVGGRGAGYRFGSRADGRFDRAPAVERRLLAAMVDMFPATRDAQISHAWGGVYGLHRDAEPTVAYDRNTGLAYAGGYGGEGIALSNLAGRTLAALIAGSTRLETRLCWTNRAPRRWESEPLRFVGVRGVSAFATCADAYEDRTNRTMPLMSAVLHRLT